MDKLLKTTVKTKSAGDGLSHQDVNSINDVANCAVDAINKIMDNVYNLNAELGDFSTGFTSSEAISKVPRSRRAFGLVLRFLVIEGVVRELTYSSTKYDNSSWNDLNNWYTTGDFITEIDGGIF